MTISDVLVDAIDDIEDYQRELPVLYDPVRGEIEELKKRMRALVEKLNAPPAPEDQPVLSCRLPVRIGKKA